MSWIEGIGYGGSLLVAVSLMMNSLVRLRWLNLVGALLFAAYGALVGATPVLAVNGFIAVVDLWYLWRMNRSHEFFSLLEIARPDNAYLVRFLQFHARDVERFIPGFDLAAVPAPRMVFILRDMNPAGLVVFSEEPGAVRIHLDYVLPGYRDLRCGRFFLEHWEPRWRIEGRHRILTRAEVSPHGDYLRRLGFRRVPCPGGVCWERRLKDQAP